MNYLIFNSEDELIDVCSFNNDAEIAAYKSLNPSHNVVVESEFESLYLEEDDEILDDDEGEF